ncbi:MAG: SRPBCC domain-containing protein [Steroidobacteraceae bacterium]
MSAGDDHARVSMRINVPADVAFKFFTQNIEQWWRRGPRYRNSSGDQGMICLESGVGGRLFESVTVAGQNSIIEIGRISVWDPPRRLVFNWRNVNFSATEHTEVEVLFEASGTATNVIVTHSGWSAIRADHPVRHGAKVEQFLRAQGDWWAEQLRSLDRKLGMNLCQGRPDEVH